MNTFVSHKIFFAPLFIWFNEGDIISQKKIQLLVFLELIRKLKDDHTDENK